MSAQQRVQDKQEIIPLSKRPVDILIVVFFAVNILVITYIVDLEQLVIADPSHFTYPIWPPAPAVDIIHTYARTYDPLQLARPVWWKMTIWIDDLLYGPFYLVAIYAFVKGKNWIRTPSIFYSGMLFATVVIILGEEKAGPHASPNFPFVLLVNLPWLLFPLIISARMWAGGETPFTRRVPSTVGAAAPGAESLAASGGA